MKNRRGFTLLEPIVVAVILGILASIAMQRFANTKERAYLTAMKADLRNLIITELVSSTDSLRYTTVIGGGKPACR